MAMTIWKYPLAIVDSQHVVMPMTSELLHVDVQNGQVQLWAMVNPDRPTRPYLIHMFGTGHIVPKGLEMIHIGSVMLEGGALVFHVFEDLTL